MSAALATIALVLAGAITERQHASVDGWAAQEGGTRGGALAAPVNVYTVHDPTQLRAALQANVGPRIVRVAARIDMSEGRPFTSARDQAARALVRIPSDTTLLGVTPDAGFVNASLSVSNVSQVILRNLALRNPCDVEPEWDPHDGARGNWNARYDGISISNSHHVWIDHNSFTDAPLTDDTQPVDHGMPRQCHDGALDITNGSDFVSVTYNHFTLHQKNTLVGGADRASGDRAHLRVTFKGNLFENVSERAPRVRYGQVHLVNNYHVGDRAHPVYPHHYSVGVAHEAHVISHANAYDIAGATQCAHVVRDPGRSPGVHDDTGSILNGRPLGKCDFGGDVGWRAPYPVVALPANEVAQHVRAHAGPRSVQYQDGYTEARVAPQIGSAPFVLRARRNRQGHWQGASVHAVEAGKTLEIALLEARGAAPRRLKQVRRRAPLAGTAVVLRFASQQGELSVWLDGEKVTSVRASAIPVDEPAAWDGELLDLRDGPAGIPPAGVGLRLAGTSLRLQAGDPPERISVVGAGLVAATTAPDVAAVDTADGALVVTPLTPGQATVTVRDPALDWGQVSFALEVGRPFAAPAATPPPATLLRPRPGERGVPPDTPLRITFRQAPVLSGQGSVRIIRQRDGAHIATVRPGEAFIALGPEGRQRFVRHSPIQVHARSLLVRMPVRLDYDAGYEAVVEASLLQGTQFKGARWRFRTTPYRPVGDSITVDDDGRADFRTVQGALDHAMSLARHEPVTVNVHDGVYPELLYLRGKDHVVLRGQSREATVIRAANSEALNPGRGRALFLAEDSDLLEIRDIALHNSARRDGAHSAQAEALLFSNDQGRLVVRNAHLSSEQDTLQLTGYAWFHRSLIEGNVDFIWGDNRAALFEESEIRSIGDSASATQGGYLVQARTVERKDPGFVFVRSRLTQGAGPAGNQPPPASVYLARSPGTTHTWDNVAFVHCTIGPHIARDGWLDEPPPNPLVGDAASGWREFGNTSAAGRPLAFGSYRMSEDEARQLATRRAVFRGFNGGEGWDPLP